tara:strand:+ start:1031 stop:1837 length:807 start_codon:yes stop_codon:yes gene_type:complete
MDKELSFWKDNGRLINFQVDGNDKLKRFFECGFAKRDEKYGSPNYRHSKEGIITTSKWELAEAFFSHFSSGQFAELMLKYASSADGDMELRVAKEVAVLDDYLHYGYAFNIQRNRRYNFWRLFVPGYSCEELKKIIPNKFQSRTKVQGFGKLPGVSPILVGTRKREVVGKLRDYSSGHLASEDEIALLMMGRSSNLTKRDILQAKLYRRWNHPVLLLDNTREGAWLPTQTNSDYVLEALSTDYPKLNNSFCDSRGYRKDFTAEYLYFC